MATGIGNLEMSTISGGSTQQFSTGGLINVPDHLRKLDEQAFTPLLISIGPIHHSNVKLQTMKKYKVLFCERFMLRANINLQNLEDKIRRREDEIRSYYTETILSSISSDDFVTMIRVDGMFILEYFLRDSDPRLVGNDHMIAEWMRPILKFDLVLLENQLPFFVLEMLFNLATFPDDLEINHLPLRYLAFGFFQCYNFQMKQLGYFNVKIEHFTDLVRLFYLSEQLLDRRSGGAKLSYSATQLHEAGIKFKGVEFDENMRRYRGNRRFLDIRFDLKKGVLEIPCFALNEEKIRLIQNIIALEQSIYVEHAYVTDFFVILNFLIKTSKDVDLLCDKGILINYLGDSNAATSAVNNLNTKILGDYMNKEYLKICEDLNASYEQLWYGWRAPWHRWRETLWRQYFSTPWRAASTSGGIILLVLTAIQTVCSLKSTKW